MTKFLNVRLRRQGPVRRRGGDGTFSGGTAARNGRRSRDLVSGSKRGRHRETRSPKAPVLVLIKYIIDTYTRPLHTKPIRNRIPLFFPLLMHKGNSWRLLGLRLQSYARGITGILIFEQLDFSYGGQLLPEKNRKSKRAIIEETSLANLLFFENPS